MKITNVLILLFLLSALAIGTSFYQSGGDVGEIDVVINNASSILRNISLESNNSSSEVSGILIVMEEYIHFIGILGMEVMRYGTHFGYDNPDYFEPVFIMKIIKLIIYLIIISLLIKPVFYLLIFIVMFVIWIKDIINKRYNPTITKQSKQSVEEKKT